MIEFVIPLFSSSTRQRPRKAFGGRHWGYVVDVPRRTTRGNAQPRTAETHEEKGVEVRSFDRWTMHRVCEKRTYSPSHSPRENAEAIIFSRCLRTRSPCSATRDPRSRVRDVDAAVCPPHRSPPLAVSRRRTLSPREPSRSRPSPPHRRNAHRFDIVTAMLWSIDEAGRFSENGACRPKEIAE